MVVVIHQQMEKML